MFFILIFLPKAISFHIWRLKCICIFLLFTKSMGQLCAIFLDFMDSPSQTYRKWPLAKMYRHGQPILDQSRNWLIIKNSQFLLNNCEIWSKLIDWTKRPISGPIHNGMPIPVCTVLYWHEYSVLSAIIFTYKNIQDSIK